VTKERVCSDVITVLSNYNLFSLIFLWPENNEVMLLSLLVTGLRCVVAYMLFSAYGTQNKNEVAIKAQAQWKQNILV